MLREDSKLASYTPDVAGEIDGEHGELIERFAAMAQGWKGLPPTTRLGFEKAVVGIFIESLKAGLLEQAIEEGRQDAYNLAAVAMFQLLDMIIDHENPAFIKACLSVAIGVEARSQVDVAEEFGVERATVSKWARRFVETLNLVPSRGMRRPEAVAKYSERQTEIWAERKAA